ncbi:hypothetical protein G9A89_015361 [Geosiphon pyriformis]|nr:hypothetical protein G9A89_015361 [Geosiphon pyriformis]
MEQIDPSAALLSLLHQNQSSPAESSGAFQRNSSAQSSFSQTNSQPPTQSSPLLQQDSTSTALSLFSVSPYRDPGSQSFNGGLSLISGMTLPSNGVPPASPPPLSPPLETISPLSSHIHVLKPIPMAPPPPPMSYVTSYTRVASTNASSESASPSTSSAALNVDPTLNVDEVQTKSLKLALFGPQQISQFEVENNISYQQEDRLILPSIDPDIAQVTKIVEEKIVSPTEPVAEEPNPSPIKVIDYNTLGSLSVIKPTSKSESSSSEKQSPIAAHKSIFTYTNPFDLLKKSPPSTSPPTQEFVPQQWSTFNSSPSLKKREVSTVQKEGGMFSRPQHQTEPFLSGLSAWNVRATSALKTDLSTPDGVRLPPNDIIYSAAERNEAVLCTKDLNLETITLVPSDLEYRVGKSIAVNGQYICYTVKAGKVRVISLLFGSKTLLRNHEKPILDICIQPSPAIDAPTEKQLLLAIGADSKITVWELSEPPQEQNAEIPYKTILEIDGKGSADDKQRRYLRAIWHPLNRNMFAVATDTNDVLLINIDKLLQGKEIGSFKEFEIAERIIKTDRHDEPITDMAFSYDGTILATASFENIMFSESEINDDVFEGIGPIHKIIMSGEQISSLFLVNPDSWLIGSQELQLKCRYAIIGTERNTKLHLYDVVEGQIIQTITFLPPPARRPSLNKAYRKEEDMFNCIDFDQHSGTLVLANSARISIIALHLNTSREKIDDSSIPQYNTAAKEPIENELTTSLEEYSAESSNLAQFDYMIEYPINQLVGSFVLVSDVSTSNQSNGFSFYCIQSKAVQQYHIACEVLLPNNIDACPLFESATRMVGPVEHDDKKIFTMESMVDDIKEEAEKRLTKSSVKSENSQYPVFDEKIEKDLIKETVVGQASTVAEIPPNDLNALGSEIQEIEVTEKRTVSEYASDNILEAALSALNNPEEIEGKSLDNPKGTSSGIKLSGSAVNVTIAKLKEKKRGNGSTVHSDTLSDSEKNIRRKESRKVIEKEKEKEVADGFSDTIGKPAGKKAINGKLTSSAEKSRRNADTPQEIPNNRTNAGTKLFSPTNPLSSSSGYELLIANDVSQQGQRRSIASPEVYSNQNLTRELKKIEDSLTNKISKMFAKEMDKQYQRLEDERNSHQAAETTRQETILKLVSQALNNNTAKFLESTIRSEIQNNVIPMLNKLVATSVDKQVNRGMVEAINKSIPAAIDKTVTENVQRVLSKSSVIDSIAKSVSKSIKPIIEEIYRENFSNMLIPSYQNATTAMFEQIHRTFEAGLQQIAQKTAQSHAGSAAESSAIVRLQASIDQLTISMSQLQQVQQLQATMQANLISQLNGSHSEQQIGRNSNEYPFSLLEILKILIKKFPCKHQLARELKKMLNPQVMAASQTSSTIAQDLYGYPSSGRTSSSQQQQQHHQQTPLQQHHLQQQRQIFSPMEPPGLVELKTTIDRLLELGEYEEAFLKALASSDLSIILRLCNKVSPKTVFFPSRPLLSQPVILSLVHQLTFDLSNYPELKFLWIEEALIHLVPKDKTIRDHSQVILQLARQRLIDRCSQIASEENQNPYLKSITVLIHILNSLMKYPNTQT